MHKINKIWANNIFGIVVSAALLYFIYIKVAAQVASLNKYDWQHTGPIVFLLLSVALMFVNTALETTKWHLLSGFVQPITWMNAFASYLAGMALSIVTPNRIGEYPGRIMYLGRKQTFRYINVAVLGAIAQLLGVFLFGLVAMAFYATNHRNLATMLALLFCILACILFMLSYIRFEVWLAKLSATRLLGQRLARYITYCRLLKRVPPDKQIKVLGISMVRFAVYSSQYLFMLLYMDIKVPLAEGFCLSVLFFWAMTVIPSIALAELGIRGGVAVFLFQQYSPNTIGILVATTAIWLLNLVLPSVIGSVLIIKMKIVR